MNNTDIRDPEVEEFLAAVRRALDDLPAGVVDELVDGLAADLSEARAERDEPLERIVGSPEAYATELRAAAGLPPRTGPLEAAPSPPLTKRLAGAIAPLAEVPAIGPVWRLLVELRPAWWVLRAYFAVWLLLTFVTFEPLRFYPILTAGRGAGGILVASGVLVVAIAGSVWLGRQSLTGALRLLVIAANVFAVYVGYNVILEGAQPRIVHPAVDAVHPAVPGETGGELLD